MKAATASIAVAIALYGPASDANGERAEFFLLGKQVYERNCIACHGFGPGYPPFAELPGTEALRVKYDGRVPALLTERVDLTPEMVAYFVRNGSSVMPFYRKTEISETELAALGAYLSRNTSDQ